MPPGLSGSHPVLAAQPKSGSALARAREEASVEEASFPVLASRADLAPTWGAHAVFVAHMAFVADVASMAWHLMAAMLAMANARSSACSRARGAAVELGPGVPERTGFVHAPEWR